MIQWLLQVLVEEVLSLVGTVVPSLLCKIKAEMLEVIEIGDNKNGFTGESNTNGGIDDEVRGDKQYNGNDGPVKLEENFYCDYAKSCCTHSNL